MEQLFKPSVIWDSILAIIPSIPITMLITLIAGLLGLLFGFILAVLRIKKIPVLAQLATVYISCLLYTSERSVRRDSPMKSLCCRGR